MLLPYYFTILSILKVVFKDFDFSLIHTNQKDGFLDGLIKSSVFFLPFVIFLIFLFSFLDRYEKEKLSKKEEQKWLIIASVIFFGGIVILFTVPKFLISIL